MAGAGSAARPTVIENGTVLVEGNRVTAIGPQAPFGSGRGEAYRGARQDDHPGHHRPHAHLGGENDGILAESWPLVANLAYGVTTSHDPSNDTETVFTNSELIRSGAKLGPRLYSTGTSCTAPRRRSKRSWTLRGCDSHLRRQKAVGAFSVKSYNQQRRDARQMIIKAARALEMLVVPEGGSLLYMNNTHVLDGHTGVEHSLPVAADL